MNGGVSDPYAVLGISRGASHDEIKAAFLRLAKRCHPDVDHTPGAEERFKELAEAYIALGGKTGKENKTGNVGPNNHLDAIERLMRIIQEILNRYRGGCGPALQEKWESDISRMEAAGDYEGLARMALGGFKEDIWEFEREGKLNMNEVLLYTLIGKDMARKAWAGAICILVAQENYGQLLSWAADIEIDRYDRRFRVEAGLPAVKGLEKKRDYRTLKRICDSYDGPYGFVFPQEVRSAASKATHIENRVKNLWQDWRASRLARRKAKEMALQPAQPGIRRDTL